MNLQFIGLIALFMLNNATGVGLKKKKKKKRNYSKRRHKRSLPKRSLNLKTYHNHQFENPLPPLIWKPTTNIDLKIHHNH